MSWVNCHHRQWHAHIYIYIYIYSRKTKKMMNLFFLVFYTKNDQLRHVYITSFEFCMHRVIWNQMIFIRNSYKVIFFYATIRLIQFNIHLFLLGRVGDQTSAPRTCMDLELIPYRGILMGSMVSLVVSKNCCTEINSLNDSAHKKILTKI